MCYTASAVWLQVLGAAVLLCWPGLRPGSWAKLTPRILANQQLIRHPFAQPNKPSQWPRRPACSCTTSPSSVHPGAFRLRNALPAPLLLAATPVQPLEACSWPRGRRGAEARRRTRPTDYHHGDNGWPPIITHPLSPAACRLARRSAPASCWPWARWPTRCEPRVTGRRSVPAFALALKRRATTPVFCPGQPGPARRVAQLEAHDAVWPNACAGGERCTRQ